MEWLSITLSVVAILGLLWAFSQIGRVIEDLSKAEVEIADLKISRDRMREDIDSLSGLLRAQTGIVHERR